MNVHKMIKSFGFARKGFLHLLASENNFQFHFLAALLVLVCGFWLELSRIEWIVLIVQIGLVLPRKRLTRLLRNCVMSFLQTGTRLLRK